MPPPDAALNAERARFKSLIATAIIDEDDPLAAYDQFVQWTLSHYGDKDPNSGLLELLEEATRTFKDDPSYKGDLRYFKLWSLYARQIDRATAINIFAFLLTNEIGTTYAVLYEEYAGLLEQDGRRSEVEAIYRKGIKRRARPLERLKNRYREFQERSSLKADLPPPPPYTASSASGSSRSAASSPAPPFSTPSSRYALMLAPPAPGKRPEKLQFKMSLLFTDDHVEYSMPEARARSMGLLGKVWGPPPPELNSRQPTTSRVTLNDTVMPRRKSMMGGGAEPTMTINTKEALADVFGMYNSPEKTIRVMAPGSKHAPLRKVEPLTPASAIPLKLGQNRVPQYENGSQNSKTPTPAFRPFVDENPITGRKENTTPAPKFRPFVDDLHSKTPAITPRPALSLKDSTPLAAPANENQNAGRSARKLKAVPEDDIQGNNMFKPFTPGSHKLQEKSQPLESLDSQKPSHTGLHQRAQSHLAFTPSMPDVNVFRAASAGPTFTPFVDENIKTPFKVFSRPPALNEPVVAPEDDSEIHAASAKTAFTPFRDPKPTFTPFKDADDYSDTRDEDQIVAKVLVPSGLATDSWPRTVIEIEDDEEDLDQAEQDHSQESSQGQDQDQTHQDDDEEDEEEGQSISAQETLPLVDPEAYGDESFQNVPFGGRFGQFNVMTPITERTFEFTTSSRVSAFDGTPSARDRSTTVEAFSLQPRAESEAIRAAEQLAAELRDEEEPLHRLRFTDSESPRSGTNDAAAAESPLLEEKVGSLSLIDALTLSSKFKPANPCNPFDPLVLKTLLAIIPSDSYYYDLRDYESGLLDKMRKFSKRTRKTSGNTSSTSLLDVTSFPVSLPGRRFSVIELLGEGGFGSVFKVRELCSKGAEADGDDEEDEDEDDEDADGPSFLALKVVKPKNIWEYHILRRLHVVLTPSLQRSMVAPHALYAFRDESFLVLEFCPQGSLLNVVNNAASAGVSQQGACLDELLVMFFAIELLRLLEGMHSAGFIHGDLKIDNCLLRLEDVPGGAARWSSVYDPSGAGGWACKGVKVIDFGRTIDTGLFPSRQAFIAEWPTDERDCHEMRGDRPWTYQPDYYGLAGIIYCMLFGKYIQASSVALAPSSAGGSPRYKIATPFKRYWQTDIWTRLFDILLNSSTVRPDGQLPLCEELGAMRHEMEAWLQSNCNRTSNTLKGLLKKIELAVWQGR